MKRGFLGSLRCPTCRSDRFECAVSAEAGGEIRSGEVRCGGCDRRYPITNGVLSVIDQADEVIAREIKGWIEMAGPLGEGLVPTMTALPSYPYGPWPHCAPDFFQIFEYHSFEGEKVVDIGAGRTWSTKFIAALGRAAEVVAIDVLTTRFLGLETADVYFAEGGIYFERICGDIHRIPLRDGWADSVFSCASIHHSSDPAGLFREVWRVLRPGGRFVFISEPSKKASILETRPQNEETAHGINEHIYSFAEYVEPLRRQGFRVRWLAPRSIRYRLLYPDSDFEAGIPDVLRNLAKSDRGRDLIERLLRSRLFGPIVYRHASLPLSVIAEKPPGRA